MRILKACRSNKSIVALVLVVSMLFMLTSCYKPKSTFPVIDSPTDSEDVTDGTSESSTADDSIDDFVYLSVALPYSQTTIEYLSKLYYAKSNNLLDVAQTGADVSLDYLDSINNTSWDIKSVQTSYDGVSVSDLENWEKDSYTPDIFLADNVEELYASGRIDSLNSYLFNNSLLRADNVYINSISECSFDNELYAIPHLSTVVIVAGNKDYSLSENDVLGIDYSYTLTALYEYLNGVDALYNAEVQTGESKLVLPFYEIGDLLPYIGYMADDASHSFMFINEEVDDTDVDALVDRIEAFYIDELSSSMQMWGSDARTERNASMWLINSSEIYSWNQYYPDKMYYLPLPTSDNSYVAPMLNMKSVCISSSCANKELAADFAAFISLDSDAQMLLRRLEPQTGVLPVISSIALWNYIEDESDFGRIASFYEAYMNNAVYCPEQGSNIFYNVNKYITEYFDSVMSDITEDSVTDKFNLNDCYEG